MLIENIYNFIDKHNLIQDNATIVVGFSGGPDSLFLLHILAPLRQTKNIKLIAAHLDHEWRPTSYNESVFCHDIAKHLGIPFSVARRSQLEFDKKSSGSQEELGRRARRFFLEMVRKEYNADKIALAHHLDDQEETFFIRLIRGTTISGLASMKPRDGYYIRPLLEVLKRDIIAYLENNNIAYITDPTNMSDAYLRTRIRNYVIPALRQCDNRFDANFQRTLLHIQETEAFLNTITAKTFQEVTEQEKSGWSLNLTAFFDLEPFLQNRILMHWLIIHKVSFVPTQNFLDEIMRFLKQPINKKHTIHHAWSITKIENKAHIIKPTK